MLTSLKKLGAAVAAAFAVAGCATQNQCVTTVQSVQTRTTSGNSANIWGGRETAVTTCRYNDYIPKGQWNLPDHLKGGTPR